MIFVKQRQAGLGDLNGFSHVEGWYKRCIRNWRNSRWKSY